jgi:hypothetical protein
VRQTPETRSEDEESAVIAWFIVTGLVLFLVGWYARGRWDKAGQTMNQLLGRYPLEKAHEDSDEERRSILDPPRDDEAGSA